MRGTLKSHMDLHGWEVRRVRPGWFNLWMRGGIFPEAGGPIQHVAKVLNKRLGVDYV